MARHDSFWRLACAASVILVAAASMAQVALGQYTFVQDTDATGNWDDVTRWTDGGSNTTFPNAVGATVLINQPIKTGTGLYTLTLPATDVTVGEMTIDNTGFSNTTRTHFANGGGQLVFQTTSGPAKYIETPNTGTAPANTQNQIHANVLLESDLEITQNNYPNLNTGTIFTGIINGNSSRTITKKGMGGIQFNYAFSLGAGEGFEGQFVIEAGSIRLINSSSTISKSSGVTVLSGGQFQLADNAATAVPDYNLASGAVLNLNGPGTASSATTIDGALRIGITDGRTATFHSPVNLQSDAHISVAAANTFGVLDNVVSGPATARLIKTGSGKLSLTNAGNNYAGDTEVRAGTLSITNAFLADAADVSLVTGSILDLSFSGEDEISSLFIDDVGQATGLWGATGNLDADFQTDLITGTGLLNVTVLAALTGDYNDDGVVDAADYVLWRKDPASFGGDPDGYNAWRDNFGATSGGGSDLANSSAVPEPGALGLAIAGLLIVGCYRRRQA